MAMKAADLVKKKAGKSGKSSKADALVNWIGGRRNAAKKLTKTAKKGSNDEQDED